MCFGLVSKKTCGTFSILALVWSPTTYAEKKEGKTYLDLGFIRYYHLYIMLLVYICTVVI